MATLKAIFLLMLVWLQQFKANMLTQVLPAYLYQQYTKDPYSEDLQAFFTAYNNESQVRLEATNSLNLPIYTKQIAPLLDWTAYGIYGVLRPSIGTPSHFSPVGAYNTYEYDVRAYSQDTEIAPNNYYIVNDDIFKRILTWNFYKGDGFQYNTQWLKRRIKRFLFGVDGVDFPITDTFDISIIYGTNNTVTITLPNYAITPVFESCLLSGVLNVPFEYSYIVDVNAGLVPWQNNSSTTIGWKNNSSVTVTWYSVI